MTTTSLAGIGYLSCMILFALGCTILEAKIRRSGVDSVKGSSSGMVAIRLSLAGVGIVTLMVIGSLLTN